LFGSQLTGTARPDSDIDLLVEFEPDATPSLLTMAAIEIELADQSDDGIVAREGLRLDL
jgi:hypothetical protein